MNRHIRFIDQSNDCVKPALLGNCESGVDLQPELREADDVSEV